jgi:hypothetical protein
MIWWQVNPHFGHLWATTCPNDETWQAGEGRSTGYRDKSSTGNKVRMTNVKDSHDIIPLFPRDTVRANCRRAVAGSLTANGADYRGLRGDVRMRPDSLVIGSEMRDRFARKYIYKSGTYKEISFVVDSVSKVQVRNDTIRGEAHGVFSIRDAKSVIAVPFYAVSEGQDLRVRGKWHVTAKAMVSDYHIPKSAMAMGVGSKMFDELHMGFDLILRRATTP